MVRRMMFGWLVGLVATVASLGAPAEDDPAADLAALGARPHLRVDVRPPAIDPLAMLVRNQSQGEVMERDHCHPVGFGQPILNVC